jgi:hypothetical protein
MVPHRRRPSRAISNSRAPVLPEVWHQLALRDEPDYLDVTLASLDNPKAVRPSYHIWTASRMPWFDTADDLPRYPGSPRLSDDEPPGVSPDALDRRAGQLRALSARPRRGGTTLGGLADHLGRDALRPLSGARRPSSALTVRHAVSRSWHGQDCERSANPARACPGFRPALATRTDSSASLVASVKNRSADERV